MYEKTYPQVNNKYQNLCVENLIYLPGVNALLSYAANQNSQH